MKKAIDILGQNIEINDYVISVTNQMNKNGLDLTLTLFKVVEIKNNGSLGVRGYGNIFIETPHKDCIKATNEQIDKHLKLRELHSEDIVKHFASGGRVSEEYSKWLLKNNI